MPRFVRARLAHGERRITLEAQINRQGSNKTRIGGSPVKPAELPRHATRRAVRTGGSADRARRPVRHVAASSTSCSSSARTAPQRRPRRLRPGAPPAQCAAQVGAGARSEGRGSVHVGRAGRPSSSCSAGELIVARGRLTRRARRARCGPRTPRSPARTTRPELGWSLSVAGADPDDEDDEGDAEADTDASRVEATSVAESFRQALAAKRTRELDRGVTLVGPHRDDLLLRVRGLL